MLVLIPRTVVVAKIKHYSSTQCKQCTTYMSTNGGNHIETSDQTYCDVKTSLFLCVFGKTASKMLR